MTADDAIRQAWARQAAQAGGGAAGVSTVAGRSGTVTLTKADVALGNVDNTSDADKPVSSATATALAGKAASAHNHDGTYAAAAHNHAGVYDPAGSAATAQAAAVQRANHTGTQLAATISDFGATALLAAPNATYRVLLDSSGSHIAARVAGTYGLAQAQPAAISGTGTLYPLNVIYIDAADYPTVGGLATKLRVRATLAVNDVAPTGNYTFGLHPVTRPATSGGAGLVIYTIGAAVAGSTVAINTPAADSHNNAASADFALPANGFYVLGFVSTATVATSSHLHISMALQQRNA